MLRMDGPRARGAAISRQAPLAGSLPRTCVISNKKRPAARFAATGLEGLKARRLKRPLAFAIARNEGNWRVSGCFRQPGEPSWQAYEPSCGPSYGRSCERRSCEPSASSQQRDEPGPSSLCASQLSWRPLEFSLSRFRFYLSQFESLELKKSCASSIILLTRNCKWKANTFAFNGECCEKSSFLSCFEWPAASAAYSACAFRKINAAHMCDASSAKWRVLRAVRHAALTTRS